MLVLSNSVIFKTKKKRILVMLYACILVTGPMTPSLTSSIGLFYPEIAHLYKSFECFLYYANVSDISTQLFLAYINIRFRNFFFYLKEAAVPISDVLFPIQ